MALKVLNRTSHGVRYFPSVQAVVNQFRPLVCISSALSTSSADKAISADGQAPAVSWPDSRLGPFGPQDPRFPLPGNIGLDLTQLPPATTAAEKVHRPRRKSLAEALLEMESEDIKKTIVVDTFLRDVCENRDSQHGQASAVKESSPGAVECSVQQCPNFLHHGFMELFPDIGLQAGELTVMTISQHTKNDMSSWSPDVEEERDALMANFIENAKEICANLKSQGYWADFIEPSSGTAFFGRHTSSTLFETDERFNHLGFSILDLGCCKVITHHLWGNYVFVGSIFTNAPADSALLNHVLAR